MHSRSSLIAGALGALLVCPSSAFPQADFAWRGRLAPGQSVEIKGVNGEVRAVAAATNEVDVTATRSSRHSDPASVRIEVVPHAGGVTICAVYPDVFGQGSNRCEPGSEGRSHTRNNDVRVHFMVRVPAGVGFVGRTVNGDVSAESLGGDAEGVTVNGSVRLSATGLVRARSL